MGVENFRDEVNRLLYFPAAVGEGLPEGARDFPEFWVEVVSLVEAPEVSLMV